MGRRSHRSPEFRQHQTISEGAFAPGAAFDLSATIREIIAVHSAAGFRFRLKASRAGTLSAAFLRPGIAEGQFNSFRGELDGSDDVCATGNPSNVAVTADVEALLEIGAGGIIGEAYLLVEFTEGGVGAGTVTYANHCQL
jgi:hypothetical protein